MTPEPLFDAGLAVRRRLRAAARPEPGADFLMRRAAADLGDRLAAVERNFGRAAALFCGSADAAAAILASGKAAEVVRVEADAALLGPAAGVVAPPETVPLAPASLGLAVSLLSLHEANDVPGMLAQARRALRPDGLFLGAVAGAGTLAELRESLIAAETELAGGAAARVYPFADVRDLGALLQRAGFALPVVDLDELTVRYDTMFGLLRDLRGMGATSALAARPRRPGTRRLFARAAEIYAQRFSDADGRVRATFSLIWMSGWAPDVSQPKPARRGSATVSLAEALKPD